MIDRMKLFGAAVFAALGLLLAISGSSAWAQANSGDQPKTAIALSTTVVTISGKAGQLVYAACGNPNAALTYVQVFDTTGAVTLGTTVPTVVLPLPVSNSASLPLNANFFKGIKLAATTTATGNTAPGTPINCTFTFR